MGLLLLAACTGGGEGAAGTSALLITFDTTRHDAFGCYGAPGGLTPHIDKLAAEGVAYDRAYAVAPMTQPSHASMMTGLIPPRHTVRINGHHPLPSSAETLAELAAAAGLETAAFVSAVVLDEAFGLNQGFETYDVPQRSMAGSSAGYVSRDAAAVMKEARAWFKARDRDRAFFTWIHVWDPHPPWNPDPALLARARGNPYLAIMAGADAELGKLLTDLDEDGTLDHTVVLLVSDHGEAFGEHGEQSHSTHCYQSTVSIPLILRYPDGFQAGTRIDAVTSVTDVLPTLAEAMGLSVPKNLDGRSLYRREALEARGAYLESYYGYMSFAWSPVSGWVDADGKYLHSSVPEYYDLRTDRTESHNLDGQHPAVIARYRDAIAEAVSRPALALDEENGVDEAMRAELEKLGYAASGLGNAELPHPLADSDLPSPADRMEEWKLTIGVLSFLRAGDHAMAAKACARILETNPDNSWALDRQAICLIREKRYAEAMVPLRRVVQNGRATTITFGNLGGCYRSLGLNDEALVHFELALQLDPNELRSLRNAAELLLRAGNPEKAAAYRARFEAVTGTSF